MTSALTGAAKKPRPLVARLGLPMRGPRVADCADASGLPVDADAPAKRREIRPVGETIAALAERLGVRMAAETAEGGMGESIVAAWGEAAGALADRFRPEKYVGGILYVTGGTTAELFELRRSKLPAIEKKAKTLAPFAKLRQIRLSAASRILSAVSLLLCSENLIGIN